MSWDKLSMSERADIIKLAVQSGIKDLYAIRDTYNEFAKGGEIESPVENSNIYAGGSYLDIAKQHIKKNEGWLAKPYRDAPKGKNWRSVGYGFNDSGFRSKYPQGISKHYENGITEAQAEEELNWFLGGVVNHLKKVYGKKWDSFNDNQKAAVIDTYYQRPASVVGKGSRFYKAVMAGDKNAGNYLGVAGYSTRNKDRRKLFGASQIESVTPTQGASIAAPIPSTTNSDESYNFLEVPQLTSLPPTAYTFGSLPTVEDIARQTALEPPTPEELRRQERHEKLERFQNVMGLMSRIQPSVQSSHLGNIASVLGQQSSAQYFSDGGSIYIKPENRGRFTALKERTGHSASWFKENGTPAQKKMAIFALNARKWKHGLGGNLFDGGGDLAPIIPFNQREEVIVTPDFEYNQYLNSLPDNQRFTPNDKYDSYLYWKLNGRPKNFEEAYNKEMFTYDNSDNSYHAHTIAWDDNTGIGHFMKPKDHDTVGYELDWFNKGLVTEEGGHQRPETPEEKAESDVFRNNYILMDDPDRPNFYKYQPKKHGYGGNLFENGGTKAGIPVDYLDPLEVMPLVANNPNKSIVLDEVVVTPSKKLPMQSDLFEGITNQAANEKADEHANSVTPTAEDLFTIGTLGGLNNLSPTQWARRAYDLGEAINGNMSWDNFGNSWFYGNSGLVSDKYAQEHPYASAAINLVGDAAAFGTLSALKKLPKYTATSTPQITAENAASVTPEQWTALQDAAIARGDMAEAQRLRDLHFKVKSNTVVQNNNLPLKTYHTVNESYPANFNVFNPNIEGTHSAIYTSDSPIMSGTYANSLISNEEKEYYIQRGIDNLKYLVENNLAKGDDLIKARNALKSTESAREYVLSKTPWLNTRPNPTRQKQLYVKLNNPLMIEGHSRNWNDIPIHELPKKVYDNLRASNMNGYTTRDIERAQKLAGYDGGIIKNITDYGSTRKSAMIERKPSTVYQINSPNNLKLADVVTYDDNGIRIPLGERDNFNVNDIRWSWLLPVFGIGAGTAAVEE